ncbi:MAG: hypothetical protein QOG09_747 [Solirubrobacterales bacterium]|jgi:hypothetical protein|nr:hypothetical protein [Solirubrobacterales bacterium]MDX6662645.1 hypothetical protein [Solirubrobacterales bacterium]
MEAQPEQPRLRLRNDRRRRFVVSLIGMLGATYLAFAEGGSAPPFALASAVGLISCFAYDPEEGQRPGSFLLVGTLTLVTYLFAALAVVGGLGFPTALPLGVFVASLGVASISEGRYAFHPTARRRVLADRSVFLPVGLFFVAGMAAAVALTLQGRVEGLIIVLGGLAAFGEIFARLRAGQR